MTTPSVQFLFDFGSPNAYFCHKVLPALERRTGVKVEYVPILLGGLFKLSNNRSPVESTADIPNKRAYDMLEIQRFVKQHGLNQYKFNPFFPVNTLGIMRGAVAAQRLGCFEAYVDAVYAAMWEQGRNMGDPAEIQAVLQAAGLDAQAIVDKSVDAEVKAQLMTNTQQAHDRGAFGSPTFFVGSEIFFGKDRLAAVEQEILRQSS
jgi:2-hydroxychromene-2-carboxylate isomerase